MMKYSVLVSLLLLTGCVAQPSVKSWLDPVSYATITAQSEPLILSRVAITQKLSDRDFAKLLAVEVNRMGTRQFSNIITKQYSCWCLFSNSNR